MSKHKQSHEECRCADGGCACGGGHGHNHDHGDAGELKATLVRVIASAALLILFSALPTTGALRSSETTTVSPLSSLKLS